MFEFLHSLETSNYELFCSRCLTSTGAQTNPRIPQKHKKLILDPALKNDKYSDQVDSNVCGVVSFKLETKK